MSALPLIPSDIYEVILRYLPLRDLLQNRGVSKLWKNIIESRLRIPQFLIAVEADLERVCPISGSSPAVIVGTFTNDSKPYQQELICYSEKENLLYRLEPGKELLPIGSPRRTVLPHAGFKQFGKLILNQWNLFLDVRTGQTVPGLSERNLLRSALYGTDWTYEEDDQGRPLLLHNTTSHKKLLPFATAIIEAAQLYRTHLAVAHRSFDDLISLTVFDLSSEATPLVRRSSFLVFTVRCFPGTPYMLVFFGYTDCSLYNITSDELCRIPEPYPYVHIIIWKDFAIEDRDDELRVYDLCAMIKAQKTAGNAQIYRRIALSHSSRAQNVSFLLFDGKDFWQSKDRAPLSEVYRIRCKVK